MNIRVESNCVIEKANGTKSWTCETMDDFKANKIYKYVTNLLTHNRISKQTLYAPEPEEDVDLFVEDVERQDAESVVPLNGA